MKKKWKRKVAAALSVALVIGNGMPIMAVSAGWRRNTEGWYYVNTNGSYQTGWIQDKDGQWYFLDYHTGLMKTGWIQPRDGQWYFLDYHTGAMKTGWIQPRDGKWYFLDYHTGAMKNGWIKPRDGKWYFLDYHTGAMKNGWIKPRDGKWYYLDASSGVMQTGSVTIENKVWNLNADGTWDERSSNTISNSHSSGNKGGTSNINYWITSADQSIRINKRTREVEILKGGTDQNPIVCDKNTINLLVSGAADEIEKLTIKDTVADGTVVLDGLIVNGKTIVEGGGSSSIQFRNCILKDSLTAKKAKEANPLHILLGLGTSVSQVEIDGGNVILTADVAVGLIRTKSSMVLKGNGRIGDIEIASDIRVVLEDQIQVDRIKAESGEKSMVEVGKNAKIDAVEGDAVFTGDGTVKDYYDIILNASGGYWEVKTLDNKAGEVTKRLEIQVLKAKKNTVVGTVFDVAGIGNPLRENAVFTGWYEAADSKEIVNLNDITVGEKAVSLTAKWNVTTVDPTVSKITATVSGSSIEAEVNDISAELLITTGSAVGVVSGTVVTVGNFSAVASDASGNIVNGVASCTKESVKIGETFEVLFTPEDRMKYNVVTILVQIRVME